MKSSRASLILMMLPILGLLAFGLWRQRNPIAPPQDPNRIVITAQIKKEAIYPVDVWAGRDTKIKIAVKANKLRLPASAVQWLQCLQVVARNNGKERLLFRSDNRQFGQIYRKCGAEYGLPGFGLYIGNGGKAELGLSLRNVPREWGEIWLELDLGLRPAKNRNFWKVDINKETLNRLKKQPNAAWAWESKSLLLRKKDESVELPVVDQKPSLAMVAYHLVPPEILAHRYKKSNELRMWIHIEGTNPDPTSKLMWNEIETLTDWCIFDEQGRKQITSGKTLLVGVGGKVLCDVSHFSHKNGYFSNIEVLFSPDLAPKARKLRLKGAVCYDNGWPLMIDIPLLDRTAKLP